jgi:hypothetical protein
VDEGSHDGSDRPATERERPPIEPEPVDPENAVFVALGVLLTVAVLVGGV